MNEQEKRAADKEARKAKQQEQQKFNQLRRSALDVAGHLNSTDPKVLDAKKKILDMETVISKRQLEIQAMNVELRQEQRELAQQMQAAQRVYEKALEPFMDACFHLGEDGEATQ